MNSFKKDFKTFLDNISTMDYYRKPEILGTSHHRAQEAASGNAFPQITFWCPLSETDCWVDRPRSLPMWHFLVLKTQMSH